VYIYTYTRVLTYKGRAGKEERLILRFSSVQRVSCSGHDLGTERVGDENVGGV